VSLALIEDFRTFERHGDISAREDKKVMVSEEATRRAFDLISSDAS
jgi:hypothetical protein